MAAARPSVSVIVPFAGSPDAARTLVERLGAIEREPADEVIVVDNSPTPAFATVPDWLTVRRADREASSYYARNVGAEAARGAWLLFTDADCEPAPDVLARHFERPPAPGCGAVAGALADAPGQAGLVPRYTRLRGFLNQRHFAAMGPWAFGLTAHLLVRREAYDSVGGFVEGIRSTGDAELCWRLRAVGWTLAYNERAVVVHHHRETLRGLVRQVARYTAGSAWIRRRHGEPEYMQELDARAVARGVRNAGRALLALDADAVAFRLIDGLLLPVRRLGARLPNAAVEPEPQPAAVVVCAGRFPADGEQLAAARRAGGRVEAQARPLTRVPATALRELDVGFAEDDADVRRWRAGAQLIARHPLRAGRWLVRRRGRRLLAVAPAVRRVERAGAARLEALDPPGERLAAEIGSLAGLAR